MIIKKLDATLDRDILKRIYLYEEKIFGTAGVGQYNISPFTKYGSTYAIFNDTDIISVIEVIFSRDNIAYIYGVSTNEKYQNKGYARILMNFMFSDLKDISIFELTVTCSNTYAIRLYSSLGFKITKNLDNEYFDNEKRFLMRKEK